MPINEFDFHALKQYITSSMDLNLQRIAQEQGKKYVGSSSSMTGALAHFHFLLSQWRPITSNMLSRGFQDPLNSFTKLQRSPSAIFLRWKNGTYAIDADKEYDKSNILAGLGKSLEKLFTLPKEEYERYRKSNEEGVSLEERNAPEAFHYSTMGDFLMRSQLDAYDPRLPGEGMFDLKTRAVVSIRMDVQNFEEGMGYEIKGRFGDWESFEREYFDMIRSTFLKYSLQVRMGRMDGIFVAYHNIERMFGFQYISLPEMDWSLHGQPNTVLGDQEFKLSLELLNKILDRATAKFPEQSIRLHFETRDTSTPFMYIFAEPVTEDEAYDIQNKNRAEIEEFEARVLGLEKNKSWDKVSEDVQKSMDVDEGLEVTEEDAEETTNAQIGEVTGSSELSQIEEDSTEDQQVPQSAVTEDDKGTAVFSETANEKEQIPKSTKDGDYEGSPETVKSQSTSTQPTEDVQKESETTGAPQQSQPASYSSRILRLLGLASGETKSSSPQSLPSLPNQGVQDESVKGTVGEDLGTQQESGDHVDKELATKEDQEELASPSRSSEEDQSTLSEEELDTETEADREFLNELEQQAKAAVPEESRGLLAMTLTIRNKVNRNYIRRPEDLGPDDSWSVEYALADVKSETRAWSLYEACQKRREKHYASSDDPEDAANNFYLRRLRELSQQGREWRRQRDDLDQEKTPAVVGQEPPRADREE